MIAFDDDLKNFLVEKGLRHSDIPMATFYPNEQDYSQRSSKMTLTHNFGFVVQENYVKDHSFIRQS